jgi:hypothetical protein
MSSTANITIFKKTSFQTFDDSSTLYSHSFTDTKNEYQEYFLGVKAASAYG